MMLNLAYHSSDIYSFCGFVPPAAGHLTARGENE